MNWENLGQNLLIWAAQFGVKILGAILLWIIGRALIGFAIGLMKRSMGPVLAVRPYTNNQNYWQVYFDTNRLIRNTFGEAGFPAPGQFVFLKNSNGGDAFVQSATASGVTH